MKNFCRFFSCTGRELLRIHLVDKCLILFMLVLLAQSAFTLFFQGSTAEGTEHIDVIIRTSSAAIFGYFLSGNFIRRSSEAPPNPTDKQPDQMQAMGTDGSPDFSAHNISKPRAEYSADHLQLIIATAIGLFCLIVLIIQRDLAGSGDIFLKSATNSATIAQFRDFISGCVGFLIGTPTERTHKSGTKKDTLSL